MEEYINKKYKLNELDKELKSLIYKYNELKDTYLLIYAEKAWRQGPTGDMGINLEDYYTIYDILNNIKGEKLDFFIETPGGSGEAAEEIVRFIRKNFNEVSFVVSGQAKSAGTIIVLSGDNILMTETGSLGPIDAQIKIGRKYISAYDYVEWINEKNKKSKNKELNYFDEIIISQISPGELKKVKNSLDFAKDLVIEWLPKYKFKNWNYCEERKSIITQEIKKEKAREIAEELTNQSKWKSHGRAIKKEDLEQLGIKIYDVASNKRLNELALRIHTVIRLIFDNSNTHKIFATKDNNVWKRTSKSLQNNNKKVPFSGNKPNKQVLQARLKCPKCLKEFKLLVNPGKPKIDIETNGKRVLPLETNSDIIKCDNCNKEISLIGLKRKIDGQISKKMFD